MSFNVLGLFPGCFVPTNDGTLVGPGSGYPFGFVLDDLMRFYWRRNWNTFALQSDISASVVAGSSSDSISPINTVIAGTYTPAVSTYHDLVCGSNVTLRYIPGDPNRFSVNFGLSCYGIIYNGLYYPACGSDVSVHMVALPNTPPYPRAEVQFQWSSGFTQEYINIQLSGNPSLIQKNINFIIDGLPSCTFQVLGYGELIQVNGGTASISISQVQMNAGGSWSYPT